MNIPIYQVDAFTDQVFRGNPAAVVPLSSWPNDALLQAIAEENNLSETAFFAPSDKGYRLRWFTPIREVDLCGHATLATAYVLFEILGHTGQAITFETLSGELHVERKGKLLHMDFPAHPPQPCEIPDALLHGLGKRPFSVLAAADYLAVFDSEATIRALSPDQTWLAQLDRRGVIVTAPGTDVDFVSRFFGPKYGIPEDPVTGSAHCALAPYWAQRLGKNKFHTRQISKRGGDLYCELKGNRVDIAGHASLFLNGKIQLGL